MRYTVASAVTVRCLDILAGGEARALVFAWALTWNLLCGCARIFFYLIWMLERLTMNFVVWVLCFCVGVVYSADGDSDDCFVKWVQGYRLASGRPQKILHSVELRVCMQECSSTPGCAAFAYGSTSREKNSTICELAINSRSKTKSQVSARQRFFNPRDGRSVEPTEKNATISIDDLDRSPTYDVYIENPNSNEPCYKRDALYESTYPSGNHLGPVDRERDRDRVNGVPIDCFYRLMSGKRLVKTHTLRAISVNSLQECQDACINERGFNCKSISYRYMPSTGYSYPVSNCELSSYYMQSGTISSSYSKLDFVEDYDYDYFQRETHCKTTSSGGLGVCAVVVRRGGRVSTNLIKSSHVTVTSSQCEHLCATSLFRCRAFAFRHTTRGRDPYNRYPASSVTRELPPPEHTCLLYDTDLMRLPSYNIEPDQDFDLFEMGRLMGAECVLYEQFLNRRPGYYSPGPVTSTYAPYPENREYNREYNYGHGGSYGTEHSNRIPPRDPAPTQPHGREPMREFEREPHRDVMPYPREPARDPYPPRDPPRDAYPARDPGVHSRDPIPPDPHHRDQHSHGTGMNYLINREREGVNGAPPPPSTLETGLMIGGGGQREAYGTGTSHVRPPVMSDSPGNTTTDTPYYDKGKESCLRLLRQDSYLIPEVSRATFPVKTVEECRIECIRSLQVLRFECRTMAFRHTSHTHGGGGTCQLSDQLATDRDLIQSRDRYEGAVSYVYDDREPGCRSQGGGGGYPPHGGSYYDDRNRDRDRGSYSGYNDYYGQGQGKHTYTPSYHQTSYNQDRYAYPSASQTYYPPANRYTEYERRWSTSAPPNYNAHYWDYHNRYGGSGSGGKYSGSGHYNNYNTYPQHHQQHQQQYSEYPNGQGGTTVNGERCLRSCRQNRDAGFYYCQIDDQGSWDFCCRPDHFCGYSKGLSVPWCYVGTGPSQNIWRSCEAKGTRNNAFFSTSPNVAYLHDRLPPTVYSLTNTQVANLTKDNAIRLFTNNTIEEIGSPVDREAFVAKPVHETSQETILRISNSTAVVDKIEPPKNNTKKS